MAKTEFIFLTEIRQNLKNAWKILNKDPHVAYEKVVNILKEIRRIKTRDSITFITSDAIYLYELIALHVLGYAYLSMGNSVKARDIAEELIDVSKLSNNLEYQSLAEVIIAKLEIQVGHWEIAKQLLKKAIPILEDKHNYEFIQSALIDRAVIEQAQDNYEKCISLLLQAEAEYQKHPVNPRVASVIMSNMADVYLRVGNLDKAIEYITKSLETTKQSEDFLRYANALLRLSNIYSLQGEIEKQINILNESIAVLLEQKLYHQIAIRKIALGSAYFDLGDFISALSHYKSSLTILEQEKDQKNIAILYLNLGILYSHPSFEQRNAETAKNYFEQAEQTAIELSMPHFQAAVLESWAEACVSFGLFENGFNLLKRSTLLEKQILNEKSLQQLRDLEVKYDVALKQKDNELLAANNKALELERNHLEFQLSTNNKSLLIQMNELNAFRSDVISIIAQLDKQDEIGRKLKTKVRESHLMQGTWASYLETFSKVHPDFQATLTSKYRNLTRMEVKICILIKAGLTSEEIAQILSLSARTIENNRLRIRKKLNLGERESLSKYLIDL